ncbi:transcription-repair coupling factor [candidate division KSB1 bacterium]
MNFTEYLDSIYRSPRFQRCFAQSEEGGHFFVTGLGNTSSAIFVNGLAMRHGEPLIVVVPDFKILEAVRADLEAITSEEISHFPAYRGLHLEDKPVNKDIKLSRLKCLLNLCLEKQGIYLVEARALLHPIIKPERFRANLIRLQTGDELDLGRFVDRLISQGFQREALVEDFGEISVRGGIVDIFSPAMLEPVRIEIDYDTIRSIRVFDINDQRSINNIENVTLLPPIHDMEDGIPAQPDTDSSIFAYIPPASPVFYHQPVRAHKAVTEYIEHWQVESDNAFHYKPNEIKSLIRAIEAVFEKRTSSYITNSFTVKTRENTLDFDMKSLPRFNRNLKMFSRYVSDLQRDYAHLTVAILCDNQGQADRLKEIILDEDLLPTGYFIHVGSLEEGFLYPGGQALVINDHELFSRKHFRKPKLVYRARRVLPDELTLKVGDYVVHEDYGIGRYIGLTKVHIGDSEQEALKVQYRDGDTLFLNIEKLPRLEKYSGREGHQPELSKLGGADWSRIKNRTKRAVKNITGDLLKIYAHREAAEGYTYSPDTQWQRELEASFIYDETPDQLKACWDIKKDMESPRTMDRLICGDVGFGKTEVALRAAFKAINDGKQTAILVPTTILAQQHYETFRERLTPYPVQVDMLSRFRTRKEQVKIVEGLKNGTTDIVIGTHRLLSKDIQFKNLGLFIVDEEQRFGVSHKEKLKILRTEVDALTLTATPIPRTMHMALMGVRDLSTISTPPKNRLPIITEISEYDEDLIRAALMKELDRGGQIYFVHNRVQTIHKMVSKLEKIVPEATYGIAHGQMKERDLEQVMLSFLREDFHCLVSTMIIESGLDIPNVNTIIINQADNFGLAQLYQLRGRVGRSDIQAFAYLLTPTFERMSDVAISRLQTLSEHTELGAGMQIALKDLEIRGAGNLLGSEQSGHINAVGYDLYTRLVREAVADQMKETFPGQETEPEFPVSDVRIETDISSFLPDDYIQDQFQRVSYYRKLANVSSIEELNNYYTELQDRYGAPPVYAQNLFNLLRIKIRAASLFIQRITIAQNRFTGTFMVDTKATAAQKEQLALLVSSFVEKSSFEFQLKHDDRLNIVLALPENGTEQKIRRILEFLDSLT